MNPRGARDTESLFCMSAASASAARENDEEFRRVKDDFLRVARQHRRRELSRSESSRSPSPIRRRSSRRSKNLPKFKIAPFYANDVELWFNQLETQFDLHDITDDDERYRLACAALSGEVASDVRDILLQPFLNHKYISLKEVLIERRGLTMPERVNKVISGEKLGTDIPSRFLRRLQKTDGFGTTAVVGKAVIRQTFIRQMPASIRAHLATTPDSTSLESLAVLADRAIASENDAKDNSVGVAEVRVNDSEKLFGIMEDISRRLKKLETLGHQKKHYNNKQQTTRRRDNTTENIFFFPNANARPFAPRMAANNNSNENNDQNVVTTKVPNPCSPAPPPNSP